MISTQVNFKTTGWSLIPGPDKVEDHLSSIGLGEIAEYDPHGIAIAFLAIPGMKLIHEANPSWYEWSAWWEQTNRWIGVGMSVFDVTGFWGGSELKTDCYISDVVALWLRVQEAYPAVWLHSPECRIYAANAFLAEYAA